MKTSLASSPCNYCEESSHLYMLHLFSSQSLLASSLTEARVIGSSLLPFLFVCVVHVQHYTGQSHSPAQIFNWVAYSLMKL